MGQHREGIIMSRATRTAIGALVVAMSALTTSARAETVYDEQDLGVGFPVGINSIGAVLMQSGIYEVVGPDGTRYSPTVPAGWSSIILRGITDPLPSAPLGIAWGLIRGNSGVDQFRPAVWNPLAGGVTEVSVPAGNLWSGVFGVSADGWMYCSANNNIEWDRGYGTVFACNVEQPGVRVDAPLISGQPLAEVGFFGPDATRVFLWGGPRTALWDIATGTLTDLGEGSMVADVNHAGEAVGYDAAGSAFWSATGVRTALPSIPDGPDGPPVWPRSFRPTRISNSGWVVGYYEHSDIRDSELIWELTYASAPTVVVWNARTGDFFDLSQDIENAGGAVAVPVAVTDDGLVVGQMGMGFSILVDGGSFFAHAFVWDAQNGLVDLMPEFGIGSVAGVSPSGVQAVNRQGKVFYSEFGGPFGEHVVAWQRVDGIPQSTSLSLRPHIGNVGDTQLTAFAGYLPTATNDLGQYLSSIYLGIHVTSNLHVVVATPRGVTKPGTNIQIQPDANTSITFDGIVTPGETSVVSYASGDPDAPTVPPDFQLAGTGALINIATTATFSGDIRLELTYDDALLSAAQESQIRLLHYEVVANGPDGVAGTADDIFSWRDRTDYDRPGGFLDTTNNVLYGKTPSLSPFAIVIALDTMPPVFSGTPDVHADATSTLGAIVSFSTPTATDDVDGSVAVTCVPASGTLFGVGVTTIACTAFDARHNTATTTFDVIVRIDPRYLKGAVADALNSLVATSDKATVKKLLHAIKDIEDSLASDLWVDDFHLTEKGRKVFQEESKAVAQLLAITNPSAVVHQALLSLVEADRVLAATALTEATAANPTSTHLATAATEMDLGASSSAAGEYRDAIRHYRKAWKSAMKALGLL